MESVSPKRLGDIINLKRGYDLPATKRNEGSYPVLSSAGISGYHDEYKVSGPGVVTGRYGTLGEVYFVDGRYWPHNTALYVTDFKGNAPKYVYYLMKCLGNLQTADKSAVPGVNRNDLHERFVPFVCSPETQSKIAAVLSALDAKIELNNRINAELEAMAKTLYDYWFVQFDFPFDFTKGKPAPKGRSYKSSGGKMVYNPTLKRKIPAGWKAGTLDDMGQVVGGSTPSTTTPDNFSSEGIPWITPNDLSDRKDRKFITRGAIDVSDKGLKAASLKKYPSGTVLLTSRAPIGYMAIARGEVTTNQGFKSFIPSKEYSPAVIYYTVKNALKIIIQHGSGSTFQEISGSVLKKVPVCLPAPPVAEAFTAMIKPTFERQDILEQETQQLTELRDWLLPILMNGQVQV